MSELCATCTTMSRQDALATPTLTILHTFHDPCAPVVQYRCQCNTCGTTWHAIEVFDERNEHPSEWSWERIEPKPKP